MLLLLRTVSLQVWANFNTWAKAGRLISKFEKVEFWVYVDVKNAENQFTHFIVV